MEAVATGSKPMGAWTRIGKAIEKIPTVWMAGVIIIAAVAVGAAGTKLWERLVAVPEAVAQNHDRLSMLIDTLELPKRVIKLESDVTGLRSADSLLTAELYRQGYVQDSIATNTCITVAELQNRSPRECVKPKPR